MNLKKSLMVLPVLLMSLSLLGACGSDDENDTSSDDQSSAAQDEAGEGSDGDEYSTKVKECEVDTKTGFVVNTDTEITNESDETQSYIIHIAIKDQAGTKLGESHATSGDVAAGKTATTDGLAQATDEMKNVDLTCEVYDVTVG